MSRTMKDSGIPWIGEIPEGWVLSRIKNCTDIVMGQSPDGDSITSEPVGYLFMQGNTEFSDKYPNPSLYCQNPNKLSRVGDILMSVRAPVGALNISDKIYGIGRGLCSIKNINIDKSYLWYYLLKSSEDFDYYGNGSTFSAITVSSLNNVPLLLPPLAEQHLIATFLDKKCSEIDSLIDLQEQMIEELKAYKQSVITEVVTKGLNPDVPMKDSGIEWIDTIPMPWKVAKIKNVISLLTDYDANGSFADIASNVKVNLGVPYAWMVRATDLANQRYGLVDGNNYCDISTFNYLKKSVVHSGDVLIAKRGEIGKVYLVPNVDCPMTLAPNTYLLKLRQRVIDNRYFHYFITSEMGRMQLVLNNKSTAIGAIYKDDVKSISILLPSLREQQDIANHLDTKCTEIDNLISIKQSKIESLKEYKKSVIYEYVTGKKEV